MPAIDWTSDLEIGISCVDGDHKVLVDLINQVHDCSDQHEESMILGSALSALMEYTIYHFAREERLLELCGYAHLEAHKRAHADLAEKAQAFHQRYKDSDDGEVADEVKDFLRHWLVKHIMVQDFAFKETCSGNQTAIDEAAAMPFMNGMSVAQKPIDWSRLSVLLIDDNPNFRLLVKTILKALGVRNFKQAPNGEKGLAMLAKKPVDVVMCDWVMDGMNGAEFARKLRQFDDTSPIVLVTGHLVEMYHDQGAAAGVGGYLQKPITVRTLLEAIIQALNKPQRGV
ncbi:MAG TPA: bacteriohemerythrin [Rhodospirillales bacterium]|nr:bacteriohemerythrin [Rhodospirillales bacterium]